jgi:hypothetical protein
MAKKYRYMVSNLAEGTTCGYVDLTKAEAKIVAYATNQDNWKNVQYESWSGSFWIDIDNPIEIKDED